MVDWSRFSGQSDADLISAQSWRRYYLFGPDAVSERHPIDVASPTTYDDLQSMTYMTVCYT